MNALLRSSRKWLIVIFCFFVSATQISAQSAAKPAYRQGKDGQYRWYSLIDNTRYSWKDNHRVVYDLENAYKPFNQFSVDFVILYWSQASTYFLFQIFVDDDAIFRARSVSGQGPTDVAVLPAAYSFNIQDIGLGSGYLDDKENTAADKKNIDDIENTAAKKNVQLYKEMNVTFSQLDHLNPESIIVDKSGHTKPSALTHAVYKNLEVPLAHHLLFENPETHEITNEYTYDFGATSITSPSETFIVPIRSFLLNGGWAMKIVPAEDDNQSGTAAGPACTQAIYEAFQVSYTLNNKVSYQLLNDTNEVILKSPEGGNDLCGFVGAQYSATEPAIDPSDFINVTFTPDTFCTRKAYLYLYDANPDPNDPVGTIHEIKLTLMGHSLKDPELEWTSTTPADDDEIVYGDDHFNDDGTITIEAESMSDAPDGTSTGKVTYSIVSVDGVDESEVSIDSETGVLTVPDVTTTEENMYDTITIVIAADIEATTECEADHIETTITILPKHILVVKNTTLNTAMCEYDLIKNGHIITNYDAPIVCYFNFEPDGIACGSLGKSGNNKVNMHHVGKILVSAESLDSEHGDASIDYTEFTVERGTLYFESEGDWKTGTWTSKEGVDAPVKYNTVATVPLGKNHDAVINADCCVSTKNSTSGSLVEGTSNWVNNLTISNTGSLTVKSTGCAMVEGTLTNDAGSSKLSIKADENAQGSLIFATGAPSGNVDVVCRGTNSDADPIWQYRGIPVASASVTVPSGSYIYEWSEALLENPLGWGYEHWKNSNGSLSAWKGYAFGRLNSADEYYIYNVSGTLLCADKSVTLDYTTTNNSNNKGQNLITNSYNAAVAVSELKTEDFHNTEATLFIYNQGTYNDYKDNWDGSESSVTGDESAKVTVYPIFSGATATGVTISSIPSGQSFFLRALGTGASFDFRHGTLMVENAGDALRAPRRSEDFNILEINVEGGNQKDRVVLMENDNCSRGFDNGYDGSKFLSSDMAQIYATNDFGKTEINCDAVLAGNYIGFAAAKNGIKYTLSFNTDRLEGYNKLFLYDTENGRYIDILAGETYEFTGKHSGEDRRFILMGEREDGSSFTGSERRIEVIGDNFVVCGFDGMDVPVIISDMSGRTWWQGTTADGALFNLPSLPKGVYVISADKCNVKFAK